MIDVFSFFMKKQTVFDVSLSSRKHFFCQKKEKKLIFSCFIECMKWFSRIFFTFWWKFIQSLRAIYGLKMFFWCLLASYIACNLNKSLPFSKHKQEKWRKHMLTHFKVYFSFVFSKTNQREFIRISKYFMTFLKIRVVLWSRMV